MKILLLSVISAAVLLSLIISGWGLYERTSMKIEIANLNNKVESMSTVVAAVQTTQQGNPEKIKLSVVKGFSSKVLVIALMEPPMIGIMAPRKSG